MADLTRYSKLASTAKTFIIGASPKTPGTNEVNVDHILSLLAPDFRISWGHDFFVSTKPALQGQLDGPGFIEHLQGMSPMLATWHIEPTNTCIDAEQRTAVVRSDYYMTAQGQSEPVINDIVFWLEMDETCEKVSKAIEFVDPVASAELGKRMQGGPMKNDQAK